MHAAVQCEFPTDLDGNAVLDRLARVLDPELDEPILDLGFVRSLAVRCGRARVALRLPTSWCAVNFAYLMAEDVRRALLGVAGISRVTVSLGDHCAAPEIEAAVNAGRDFAEAFPGEGAGSLAALRRNFLRKGFFGRQQRLLQALRGAGCSPAQICELRIGEVSAGDQRIAGVLVRYLERRAEIGLDCGPAAPLIVDLDGRPFSAEILQTHYETIRAARLALDANGAFCRALSSLHRRDAEPPQHADPGGEHVRS